MTNIVKGLITKDTFEDFQSAVKGLTFEQLKTMGSDLASYSGKAAGTQLVKNEGFVEESSKGWARYGRSYSRVDDIRKELTPGFYVATYSIIGPILIPFQVTNDDILDLPGEKTESIIKVIDDFYAAKEMFAELKFVHKRGVLLKGQPGTGKSIVAFKAGRAVITKRAGVSIYATDPYSMEDNIRNIREVEPNKEILNVIEDIDMMVGMFGERKLTAFLDGESSVGGMLTLGITNDDRILSHRIMKRPSRFDVIETVGVLTKEARKSFLTQKATSLTPEQINDWVEATDDYTVPMLKELMILVLAYCYPLAESVVKINSTFKSAIVDV